MPAQMIPTTTKVLVPTGTIVTATGNSTAFTLPLADSYGIFINVTAASGTTPTLDAVLQSTPDSGTTWLNLPIKWTQLTTTGQAFVRFQQTMGLGEAASAGVALGTGAATAANTPFIGAVNTTVLGASSQIPTVRIAYTVTGTTPSFTLGVYAFMAPRGNTVT